jgi:cytochrome c-type biogenesis protein CcmH
VSAAVGTYVLWPLLRRPAAVAAGGQSGRSDPGDGAAVALQVLRERRRELDAALAHLPPDAPERRAALAEFAAQAEAELPAAPALAPPAARRPLVALALAALLVLPPFALYLLTGAPEAVSPELRVAREPASLDELAADLRRRLHDDPSAVDGWRLLGRAELARGKPEEARQAFERALALLPDDAQAKVDLADATAQAQGAVLAGRPIALIREALAIDPRNPKALALAGAYEVTQRNTPAAIGYWKTLLEVLPADSEQARQVAGFVADLEAGRPPRLQPRADAPDGPGASPSASPAAPGPTPGSAATLRGRIEMERTLAARLRPDDTLFVVARTLDDQGKPVGPPVAVLRARGADLPLEFVLDDRQSMSAAARLSGVPDGTRVVVIARVSRTGEAAARSGDLQGASQPVRPGAAGLRVLIDAVVD